MEPITYYTNVLLAEHIQRFLDDLSPDQKIELAFAIGQRALDEKQSTDAIDPTAKYAPNTPEYPGTFTWHSVESQGLNIETIDDFICDGVIPAIN